MNKKHIQKEIIEKLCKEGAVKISLFGSFARGTQKKDSDIDIFVEFSEPKSLLSIARIENELSQSVHRKIDLVTKDSISPFILPHIQREKKVLV